MQFQGINSLILQNFFPENLCVGTVQMDNDEPSVNIYKGMRVVFTQNRDKKNGVVNGQPAIVLMMQGSTVLLQLPTAKKVSVYPVSTTENQSHVDRPQQCEVRTCYPFVPGYAMTICKCQGQRWPTSLCGSIQQVSAPELHT